MKKAVIDRFVDGGRVILLIGEEEKEEIVLVEDLPNDAAEGTWLKIYPDGKMEIDYEETNEVKSRIQEKMNLLRNKSKSKFRK